MVPKPESAAQQGPAQQHHDIPVRRFAITAGSDPAGGSGPYPAGSRGPSGPGGQEAGPDSGPALAGPERMADRLHLGDLMTDSRMRIWKRRLLVAIVAGLVFTVIFTWRAGLTAAVLAAIADAIYRSRTTASMPPGVRLTGAQKRTQRQLARMERSGYRALHSRPIPGSREFIDHFVVGPTGAYAIDSEAWDKRLPIRTRNARQLYHGPYTKKDRLEHARWEAQQASDRLTSQLGTPVYVRPVLAVASRVILLIWQRSTTSPSAERTAAGTALIRESARSWQAPALPHPDRPGVEFIAHLAAALDEHQRSRLTAAFAGVGYPSNSG